MRLHPSRANSCQAARTSRDCLGPFNRTTNVFLKRHEEFLILATDKPYRSSTFAEGAYANRAGSNGRFEWLAIPKAPGKTWNG